MSPTCYLQPIASQDKMTMAKSKFLVLHPDRNNLSAIIQKANAQNTKNGPFEAVILVGGPIAKCDDLPSPDVPVYFFGKTEEEGPFTEVAPNYFCVQAPWAVTKLECGLTLGFVDSSAETEIVPTKVDILFSFYWPYCIARTQKLSLVGNRGLDPIVKLAEPRYHFAVGSEKGKFYEHPLFAWDKTRTCRFISLGQEGSGIKWFYAFGIEEGADNTDGSGINPFTTSEPPKRTIEELDTPDGTKIEGNTEIIRLRAENTDKRRKIVAPEECFFCLSNPNVETHMIVSIGTHSYITIAKGPLTEPNGGLNFAGHLIIIPIRHQPVLAADSLEQDEIKNYQRTLADAFKKVDRAVVFFEVSRQDNVHFHVQMVPVPFQNALETFERALAAKTEVNNERFLHQQVLRFEKYTTETEDIKLIIQTGNFLRFTVFAEKEFQFITPLDGPGLVDLQFPRRVMAFHLKLPKRIRWDRCKQSMGQEKDECEKFKSFFDSGK